MPDIHITRIYNRRLVDSKTNFLFRLVDLSGRNPVQSTGLSKQIHFTKSKQTKSPHLYFLSDMNYCAWNIMQNTREKRNRQVTSKQEFRCFIHVFWYINTLIFLDAVVPNLCSRPDSERISIITTAMISIWNYWNELLKLLIGWKFF